jgi:hypothetical protein
MRGKLDKLIGRIRGAVQGYSGFFDLVRIDEQVLDRVYEHDMALARVVDDLAAGIEKLPTEPDRIATAVPELIRQIDETEQHWNEREDILKGLI